MEKSELKQIIREEIKRQLKEMSDSIIDYSNSENKILVGTKTNLLNNMKKRYDFEIDGDKTYFFDKKDGFHFGTLYQEGGFYELKHDGTLNDKGYRIQYVVVSKGGSIGGDKTGYDPDLEGTIIAKYNTRVEADVKAQRMNKILTPGDKGYYGRKYSVSAVQI